MFVASAFALVLASFSLPFVRLTAFVRVDTLTGIELLTLRDPSPQTVPLEQFRQRNGESYEMMMGTRVPLPDVRAEDDREIEREVRGERVVAILVFALALGGLVAALAGNRASFLAAAGGIVVLLAGVLESFNVLAILETPPDAEHLVGWWVVLGLFAAVVMSPAVTRTRARRGQVQDERS